MLRVVMKVRCVTCSSPALSAEIRDNAGSRARKRGRPELVGLILGRIEETRGQLDERQLLSFENSIATRAGWSMKDAGLKASHRKYVQVRDRHLFVLATRKKARLIVTSDGQILSGSGKLTPHGCGHPDDFVQDN